MTFFDINLNNDALISILFHLILHLIDFNEDNMKNNNDIFSNYYYDDLLLNLLIFKKNKKTS